MITKTQIAPEQSAPSISRVDGKVTGRIQYANLLVPTGSNVTVEVKVNGTKQATLGPWVATVGKGKNSLVNVRLRVKDDFELEKFPVYEAVID